MEAIGEYGLADLCSRFEDRRAVAVCTVAAIEADAEEPLEEKCSLHVGRLSGSIVSAPRGSVKHGRASWNSVFQPDGSTLTFGELTWSEQADMSHRRFALSDFASAWNL